jgi:hypothetical protein
VEHVQDQVNLQYSLFIVKGGLTGDGLLRIAIHDNLTPEPGAGRADDIGMHSWLALVGAPLAGYDTSREAFLGPTAATTTRWRWSAAHAATATPTATTPAAACRPISSCSRARAASCW